MKKMRSFLLLTATVLALSACGTPGPAPETKKQKPVTETKQEPKEEIDVSDMLDDIEKEDQNNTQLLEEQKKAFDNDVKPKIFEATKNFVALSKENENLKTKLTAPGATLSDVVNKMNELDVQYSYLIAIMEGIVIPSSFSPTQKEHTETYKSNMITVYKESRYIMQKTKEAAQGGDASQTVIDDMNRRLVTAQEAAKKAKGALKNLEYSLGVPNGSTLKGIQ